MHSGGNGKHTREVGFLDEAKGTQEKKKKVALFDDDSSASERAKAGGLEKRRREGKGRGKNGLEEILCSEALVFWAFLFFFILALVGSFGRVCSFGLCLFNFWVEDGGLGGATRIQNLFCRRPSSLPSGRGGGRDYKLERYGSWFLR